MPGGYLVVTSLVSIEDPNKRRFRCNIPPSCIPLRLVERWSALHPRKSEDRVEARLSIFAKASKDI